MASYPRDAKIDEAKSAIAELFANRPDAVLYHRQLAIHFEDRFFHWITGKALRELVEEGLLRSADIPVPGSTGKPLKVFSSPRNRYWRREAANIAKLVARFSAEAFGRAVGNHGELLVDAGLPRVKFRRIAKNVNEWRGRRWVKTGHDLDRVFERDGMEYGTEIKNTLDYIPKDELDAKLDMCDFLRLTPLFIVRMAPRSYVNLVRERGGFTLDAQLACQPHTTSSSRL